MIGRDLFGPDHELFRDTVKKFIDREIAPFHDQWEKDGIVPRELWLKAGAAGMLCCTISEDYGGAGADYLYDVIVFEELFKSGFSGRFPDPYGSCCYLHQFIWHRGTKE